MSEYMRDFESLDAVFTEMDRIRSRAEQAEQRYDELHDQRFAETRETDTLRATLSDTLVKLEESVQSIGLLRAALGEKEALIACFQNDSAGAGTTTDAQLIAGQARRKQLLDDQKAAAEVVDQVTADLRANLARVEGERDELLFKKCANCISIVEENERLTAERDGLSEALMACLLAQPMSNGEYVHLVTCSGDRREPAGKPGHSCSCAIAPRSLSDGLREKRDHFGWVPPSTS